MNLVVITIIAETTSDKNPLVALTPGLYIWTIITFLLLFYILAKFAWKPLLKMLEERENLIKNSLNDAEKAKLELERLNEESEKIMAKARVDAQEILAESKSTAEKVKEDTIAKAKEEANKNGIRIFSQPVLYDLVDEYQDWVTSDKENMQRTELDSIILPCKFQLIKGMVFRRNGPAVCGVEILGGSLKQKSSIINSEGKEVGVVKQIQDNGENIHCLLYTSPSPRDATLSRMPCSA